MNSQILKLLLHFQKSLKHNNIYKLCLYKKVDHEINLNIIASSILETHTQKLKDLSWIYHSSQKALENKNFLLHVPFYDKLNCLPC